jgi:secondary thiamine-phosphate synthase enzyme
MPKSSTSTVRGVPVRESSETGGLRVAAESITIQTGDRVELHDVTETVSTFVREAGIRDGILSLWSLHTTCALFINEAQAALHADIKRVLEEIVVRDGQWMHNDPVHSDCDRLNADAHLRAMLLGHSITLQVSGGEIVLGQWQRLLMAELDGPRPRTIRAQIMGASS